MEALGPYQPAYLLSHTDEVRMADREQDKAVMRIVDDNELILKDLANYAKTKGLQDEPKMAFILDRLNENNRKLRLLEMEDIRRHQFWDSLCLLLQQKIERWLKGSTK